MDLHCMIIVSYLHSFTLASGAKIDTWLLSTTMVLHYWFPPKPNDRLPNRGPSKSGLSYSFLRWWPAAASCDIDTCESQSVIHVVTCLYLFATFQCFLHITAAASMYLVNLLPRFFVCRRLSSCNFSTRWARSLNTAPTKYSRVLSHSKNRRPRRVNRECAAMKSTTDQTLIETATEQPRIQVMSAEECPLTQPRAFLSPTSPDLQVYNWMTKVCGLRTLRNPRKQKSRIHHAF